MMAKDIEGIKTSTRSFTAPFAIDAHAEANGWINDKNFSEVSREESGALAAGTKVTVNYKPVPWEQDVLQLFEDEGRYTGFNGEVEPCNLLDIYQNTEIIKKSCDKNWITADSATRDAGHCYIECVYEDLFKDYKESKGCLLEIGVDQGTSLLLWYLYFSKMKIHGIDIEDKRYGSPKEITVEQFDTTDLSPSLKKYVENNLKKFDIIIDDGDHRWRSQFQTAVNLFPILKDEGIYIIEDIEHPSELEQALVEELSLHIKIHDNRDVGNLNNEVIFEIRKGKTNEKNS